MQTFVTNNKQYGIQLNIACLQQQQASIDLCKSISLLLVVI